jgi:hypothetical protein
MDVNAELMQGFALVCGRRVADGITYVLSERAFVTVDHVQDDAGRIQFEGLSTWFVDAWAQWFAAVYAWKQPWETNRRYLLQVLRSEMIQPKPQPVLQRHNPPRLRLAAVENCPHHLAAK